MNWKRFIAVFVSLFVIVPCEQWLHACGGEIDPYDYFPSFFLNNTTPDVAFSPYRYTALDWVYVDQDEMTQEYDKMPNANIAEWINYTGSNLSYADVDAFVYEYPFEDLENLYNHLEKGTPLKLEANVRDNAFTKWFMQSKDLEALGYLMYAKRCEPFTQSMEGYWNDAKGEWVDAQPRDTMRLARHVKSGLQLHAAAKKESIKTRYAFQVLRICFYNERYKQTLDLSQQLVPDNQLQTSIEAKIMGLQAGAYYRTGQKAKAAYLYSKIFDKWDGEKTTAYRSFDWATDGGEIKKVLPLCKNEHEKAVLYVLSGFLNTDYVENNGVNTLRKAYAADPMVKGLDVLMGRQINVLEQHYLTAELINPNYEYNYYYDASFSERSKDSVRRISTAYMGKLNAFAQEVANGEKVSSPAFWHLSSAYLYFLQQDAPNMKAMMAKAEAAGMTAKEKSLHSVISALYIVQQQPTITPQTEAELLPSLQRIEQMVRQDARYGKLYRDMMNHLLTSRYMKQKDTIRAIYCLSRVLPNPQQDGYEEPYSYMVGFSDYPGSLLDNMSLERLKDVQDFVSKKNKTQFEQWLVERSAYTMDVLRELEGTKYLRMHDFAKAVSLLEQVPKKLQERNTLPDVFFDDLKDQQEWTARDSAKLYTPLSFARRMAELKALLEKKPNDAKLAYTYATGLYNMTYYGRAANAADYYRASYENGSYYEDNDRKAMPFHQQDYFGAYTAEKYFLQAFNNANDDELKAKAIFMAAKCWQKRAPAPLDPHWYWGYGNDEKDPYYLNSLKNPYFKQLQDYKNTQAFDAMYNTCGYLRDYVGKK